VTTTPEIITGKKKAARKKPKKTASGLKNMLMPMQQLFVTECVLQEIPRCS